MSLNQNVNIGHSASASGPLRSPPLTHFHVAKSKKNKKKKSKVTAVADDTEKNEANGSTAPTQDHNHEDDTDASDQEAESDGVPSTAPSSQTNGSSASNKDDDATRRLETAVRERDELRAQVTELRKELETIQQKHDDELARTKKQLDETQTGKEHAENRYNKLLGQVNTIKTQLGERLKSDAVRALVLSIRVFYDGRLIGG